MFVLPIHYLCCLFTLFVVVVEVQTTLCVVLFVNYSEISIIFYCISIFNIIIVFIIIFFMIQMKQTLNFELYKKDFPIVTINCLSHSH